MIVIRFFPPKVQQINERSRVITERSRVIYLMAGFSVNISDFNFHLFEDKSEFEKKTLLFIFIIIFNYFDT